MVKPDLPQIGHVRSPPLAPGRVPAPLFGFLETNKPAVIGDMERRAGVLVLGRSGMGKSSLLVRMMESDVKNNHAVFFLDPHGDAIKDFKNRCDLAGRIDDIVLLDPEKEENSFVINLLACKDVNSAKERQDTYNRAYKVFHELWQKEKEFGVFLQSSLRHTLNAFIENQPGNTLAEVPLFLTNSAFRSDLVANMKHEWVSAEFWRGEFAGKRQSDQEAYLRPLLNRVNELLASRFVRHIVGQTETTIDFSKLIDEKAIVLVRFSPALYIDIKAGGRLNSCERAYARGEKEGRA